MNLDREKRWGLALTDVLLLNLALGGAFALRFEGNIPIVFTSNFLYIALFITLVRVASFWHLGVYKGVWRYVGMSDLVTILKAISLGSIIILAATWTVVPGLGYPRSVIIIEWLGDVMLIGGIRMAFRLWSQGRHKASLKDKACSRVLIVGAGDAGEMVARQMLAHPEYGYQPVVFADDDPQKQGKKIHGITIGGGRKDILKLVEQKGADTIVIAIPSAPGPVVKAVVEQCQQAQAKVQDSPRHQGDHLGRGQHQPDPGHRAGGPVTAAGHQRQPGGDSRILKRQDHFGKRGRRLHRIGALPPDSHL